MFRFKLLSEGFDSDLKTDGITEALNLLRSIHLSHDEQVFLGLTIEARFDPQSLVLALEHPEHGDRTCARSVPVWLSGHDEATTWLIIQEAVAFRLSAGRHCVPPTTNFAIAKPMPSNNHVGG